MIGRLAFSKAGHDKGTVYIIIGEDAANVYVCDGDLKPIERPKKKNRRDFRRIQDQAVFHFISSTPPVKDGEYRIIAKMVLGVFVSCARLHAMKKLKI